VDLRHIQELLGQEQRTTTQRYLHIVKGELKKVHARSHPKERRMKTNTNGSVPLIGVENERSEEYSSGMAVVTPAKRKAHANRVIQVIREQTRLLTKTKEGALAALIQSGVLTPEGEFVRIGKNP
jgi:hypothetical protein